MRPELPAISFLCFAFLVVFIPIHRVRCNVVNLAIVSWLAGCNLVHGINALIWAGNVDIRIPEWCDIITKLLLAAIVAISGALVCMSYRLEHLSSTRPISVDPRIQRNRLLLDFVFCYGIPIIYMGIHFIVQDHRFDLVKDIGCSASIHPSSPALILMWLPPLIICSISFYFSGRAMHNFGRVPYDHFKSHIESRSPFTASLFIRRIAISLIMTGSLCLVCVFSVLSISTFESWTSWSAVHADFSVINVVTSPDDVGSIRLTWWSIPTVSIIYIILSFVIGEEVRDASKWIRKMVSRVDKPRSVFPMLLPTHTKVTHEVPEIPSRSQSVSPPRSRLQTLELRSGWDDMLDSGRSKWWTPGRKSQTSITIPDFPSPNPTSVSEDEMFRAATLDYLISPTAMTLGLPGSSTSPPRLLSVPPVYASPGKAALDRPSKPPPMVESHILHNIPSPGVPEDVKSTISSVFDVAWPLPPPPPGIASSRYLSQPQSTSPTSLIVPPRRQSGPFQDSYVPSAQGIRSLPQSGVRA